MTSNFSEAISSLHIQDPSPSASSDAQFSEYGRSVDSASSFESGYTRRGQTETDEDIKAGLAAARDLASRKKQYRTDKLSSSPAPPAHISLPHARFGLDADNEAETSTSGTKTPLPDTSMLKIALTWPADSLTSSSCRQMDSDGQVDSPIASHTPTADPRVVIQFIRNAGKGTLARLNATDSECKTREETMAAAIRTILECIGEDPDRQGLLKTPERYAKALLWMTRGYEEKLSGMLLYINFEELAY